MNRKRTKPMGLLQTFFLSFVIGPLLGLIWVEATILFHHLTHTY